MHAHALSRLHSLSHCSIQRARTHAYTHALACPSYAHSRTHASCAGAYLYGVAGSNACPTNSLRIVDADACESAALAAFKEYGRTMGGIEPAGCYLRDDGVVYFGPRKADSSSELPDGHSTSRLLCSRGSERPSLPHSCVLIRPWYLTGAQTQLNEPRSPPPLAPHTHSRTDPYTHARTRTHAHARTHAHNAHTHIHNNNDKNNNKKARLCRGHAVAYPPTHPAASLVCACAGVDVSSHAHVQAHAPTG